MSCFSDVQEAELLRHLATEIPEVEHASSLLPMTPLATAYWEIAPYFLRAKIETTSEGSLTRDATERREHAASVRTHATALAALLRSRPTEIGRLDLTAENFEAIALMGSSWPLVVQAIALIAETATIEEAELQQPKRQGRRPQQWRDELIAAVFHAYPIGLAKKSEGSHFERTVEMLLGFLNREVSDLHGVVIDALKRCPDRPRR